MCKYVNVRTRLWSKAYTSAIDQAWLRQQIEFIMLALFTESTFPLEQ